MAPIATDVDRVRLLISDVGGESGSDYIFDNDQIQGFLEMENHVYSAAALALRTLAGNEALLFKRITILELKTDGPAVAKELRELAKELDNRADLANGDDEAADPVIANMGDSPFTRRDIRLGNAGFPGA